MDMNKMLQQVQQMQADMLKAQEELASERVEASVGGGMVTVTASGAGEIVGVKISPEAIDPDDPETLEDLVPRRRKPGAEERSGSRAIEARRRRRRPQGPGPTGPVVKLGLTCSAPPSRT